MEIFSSRLRRGLGDLLLCRCSPIPVNHWRADEVSELLLYLHWKPVLGENCLEIFLFLTVYLTSCGQFTLNIGFYSKDKAKGVKVACIRLLTSNCTINYLNYFSGFHFASTEERVSHLLVSYSVVRQACYWIWCLNTGGCRNLHR